MTRLPTTASNGSWKSPYEAGFRQRLRPGRRATWRQLLRVHGSHHIYGRPGSVVRLSIPIHGNRPLKPGLLRAQMKHAGLTEADF
ncbi:MAG: type II toxin-antitoxin system HicA family toxin [Tepidisphaeraceae bacterium]